jgi:hypothetical protein
MPQNGVVADWHAETFHQPFSRPATSAVAEKMNKFGDSLGLPSEDDGNIGCADVSTAPGIGDRSLLPVPPQRSPNDRRLARPQEPARPAREPNPCSFACSLIGETPDQTNQHGK